MNHGCERRKKIARGEDEYRPPRTKHYADYQCPRCKCPLEPDDTDCMACGYLMRRPKEANGKH